MGAVPREVEPLFAKAITLLVLSYAFVATRLGVRIFMIRAFGWDDAFLILALISFTILSWLTVEDAVLPLQSRTKEHAIQLVRYLATSQAMYTVTNIFFKVSMGLFYLRFLTPKPQIRFVYASISFYIVYSIALLIVVCYLFRDPQTILQTRIAGHCIKDCNVWAAVGPMNYLAGALNSAIDFAFAVLPILFLRKAMLPKRTKASICALLCFGAVSGICSVVRLCYVGNLNLNAKGFPNPTAVITSLIELAVAIISISLAACRPLFKSFYSQTVSSMNRTAIGREKHSDHSDDTRSGARFVTVHGSELQTLPAARIEPKGKDSGPEIRVQTVIDIEKGMGVDKDLAMAWDESPR